MNTVHLVITDLFLSGEFAADASADLSLPSLEKLLARGTLEEFARTDDSELSLQKHLTGLFGLPDAAGIAAISAAFDGLGEGCWLRADPVHMALRGKQLVLFLEPEVVAGEAARFCASLNEYFSGQDMEFFAPHPQRWYVRLNGSPGIDTVPLSLAAGRSIADLLPGGTEATRWRQVFNEIQMLLFAHPINAEREARGMPSVNGVWLWGGGCEFVAPSSKAYDSVMSDDVLPEMFAAAAGVPFAGWPQRWGDPLSRSPLLNPLPRPSPQSSPEALSSNLSRKRERKRTRKAILDSRGRGSERERQFSILAGEEANEKDNPQFLREREYSLEGRQLLVFTGLRAALRRGDLGGWRDALQEFETGYAQPLWRALRAGRISRLQIDVLGGDGNWRTTLTRADAWAFWRRGRGLAV